MYKNERPIYIVDGSRTPFMKAVNKPNPLAASDLAVAAAAPLLARQPFAPSDIQEVVVGCVAPLPEEANIARLIALRLGTGFKVDAFTVQRNCASGLQAIDSAFLNIASGQYDLILAGGTECMSRAPLLLQDKMVAWLANLRGAKSLLAKLSVIAELRPYFLKPVISLLKALNDPIVSLSMGQTAEILADQFNISRLEMDTFAMRSHQQAIQAQKRGDFKEIETLYDWRGNLLDSDNGIRPDSSLEKLTRLPAVFEKPFGVITAGNSSQVSDGAAFVILASEKAVKQYKLPVLGRIIQTSWAALDPSIMGLGPVHAIAKLLEETKLKLSDIDYFEINEAFAGQVLACLRAMQDENYCQKELGLKAAMGTINMDRLNVDGGAIAIGHPVGASGVRLVLHLLKILEREKAKRGIASLCIGGGQGGAILLERE
jgi:acetyl-CoA C-acetyltransferase